jgi:group I intron endonuclease
MNDDKKGIYKILNLLTGDFYIGSTSLSFKRRFIQHQSDLRKGKHRNIHLQRAYNRDGEQNFQYMILEILEDNLIIIQREQWHLDQKPSYNIATIAENNAKGRKATPEQRRRMSEARKGTPAWNKGIPFSEESRKKMSASMKGRTASNKGQRGLTHKPIQRSDGVVFQNPTLAADELGVKANTVIKAATDKNKIRTVKGFTFKYLDKDNKEEL